MFSSADTGAASDSAPASASSQRGSPPVKRRGTAPPAAAGCEGDAAPEGGRDFALASVVLLLDSCSTTGELEAAMGLPRYFASDSPGSRIGSSAASKFGAVGERLLCRGVSGRRLSKPRCAGPRGSNPRG